MISPFNLAVKQIDTTGFLISDIIKTAVIATGAKSK